MSQDFGQQTTPQSPQDNKPRNNTMVLWIIIGVLLIACIYLFTSRQSAVNQTEQTTSELATSDSSRQAIQTDYNAALARLDQLVTKNAEMDSAIHGKDGEIGKLRAQIDAIMHDSRANAGDLKKARELIKQLNAKTKSYEERIAELEGENKDLTGKNEVLTQERDSTVSKNIAMKKLGSVLHASNIRMMPIHLKNGGKKETETEHARRMDILRVVFDIDENRIADDGTKQVQLRIAGPDGTVFSETSYGSGTLKTADGQSVNYTLTKDIALKQASPVKDVTVDWHKTGDFKQGVYTIEIYNEGYKIGSGSVTMKK